MSDLYLDENVSHAYVPLLEAKGHTTLTPSQAGTLNADDDRHLLIATDLGRLLITQDSEDYLLLYKAWRSLAKRWNVDPGEHAGILVIPQVPKPLRPRIASEIDSLLRGRDKLWNRYVTYDLKWGWSVEA